MTQQDYEKAWLDIAEEWRISPDSTVCKDIFDRAYALGKQEKPADTVIQGWVARDKEGYLVLHYKEPHRTLGNTRWYSAQSQKSLPRDTFPDLTWNDDPQECEIIIKRKKK